MCSSNPPPAPDYAGAATAQGAANKDAAIAASNLNNPNVVGPYGSQTYTEGANPGDRPTVTQTLSPAQQAILDKSNEVKGLLGGLGVQGATSLQGTIGKPIDFSGAPQAKALDFSGLPQTQDYNSTRNNVINAMMSRTNEDYAKQKDQTNSDLIASGIRPGTKAYADQMQMIERSRNDARNQAEISGGNAAAQAYGVDANRRQQGVSELTNQFSSDTQRRKDAISEMLSQRGVPLNEITALMSGSQVSNPFANPGYSAANIAPAPIFGATDAAGNYNADIYNAKAGQKAGLQSGLFGLGGAAINAFSDRRLKTDIVKVGKMLSGLTIYSYRYLWSKVKEIGVMADEVEKIFPEAVSEHHGFKMVDYSKL
jgi:hypothetical protein